MVEILSQILGTYAFTLSLTDSSGPWGILERIRNIKWIDDIGLLNCFLCTSFYVSILACVAVGRIELMPLTWGAVVIVNQVIMAYTVK